MQYQVHQEAAVVWGGVPAGSCGRCQGLSGSPDSGQELLEQLQERGSLPASPIVMLAPAGEPIRGGKITLL